MRKHSRKLAVLTAIVVGVGGLGIAYAFWSSSGNGAGSAKTGKSSAFTVTADANTAADLTPTGPIDTVNFTVHNPSSGHQNLDQVVAKVAKSDGTAWTAQADATKPPCTASDFSVNGAAAGAAYTFNHSNTTTDPSPLPDNLGPNGSATSDYTNHITVQMMDNLANQDNCQSVTVPLYFSAS